MPSVPPEGRRGTGGAEMLDRGRSATRERTNAALVGIGLAVLTVVFVLLLPRKIDGIQFLAVLLGFIAGAYLGFAVADGRRAALILQAAGIVVFVSAATLALWFDLPHVLTAGYAAHGIWDALHPHPLPTEVKGWYPPFCLAYDLAIAVFLVVWL